MIVLREGEFVVSAYCSISGYSGDFSNTHYAMTNLGVWWKHSGNRWYYYDKGTWK
jgi:hypothetical protein